MLACYLKNCYHPQKSAYPMIMHRVVSDADILWKYPKSEGLQVAEKVQILYCDVNGEWDIPLL